MQIATETLTIDTPGRGFTEITARLRAFVARQAKGDHGQLTAWIKHTSASLIVCENADPDVLRDLETWMVRAVPDGDSEFIHTAEGPDDMPAHVRSVLTASSQVIPVVDGALCLGTWQGVFLWEHRHRAHRRSVVLSLVST